MHPFQPPWPAPPTLRASRTARRVMAWAGLVGGFVTVAALAQPVPAGESAERERIASDRRAIDDRHDALLRECQGRFAVTDCVDGVQRQRREALAPLRARELQLVDAQRQRRADERRAAVAARQQARPSAPAPVPQVRLRSPAAAASSPRVSVGPGPRDPPVRAASGPSAARDDAESRRAPEAAERAQAAQRRREAAEATQQRIRQRLEERAASGKVAQPLPLPGSAPAR